MIAALLVIAALASGLVIRAVLFDSKPFKPDIYIAPKPVFKGKKK